MAKTRISGKKAGPQKRSKRVNLAFLDKLIAEATVDCYNESEQITGIFTMLEENLAVPFKTNLLGMEVTVERIDMTDAKDIVAVCRRGRERQRSPFWTSHCRSQDREAQSGLMPSVDGLKGDKRCRKNVSQIIYRSG
jgi:hypothetical protein